MKRIISALLCCIVAAALLIPGAFAAPHDDLEYYISDYHVNVVANPDRSYDVTETITVFFNVESRGITRRIPTSGAAESYEIVDLRANGDPYTETGTGSIRIGDPDIYLTGEKTYNITYTLSHYADPETDYDYFYFNIIGTEWDTAIDNFSAEITLPDGAVVNNVTLTGGYGGSTSNEVAAYTVENGVIHVTCLNPGSALSAYDGVTINAELNEGAFYEAKQYLPEFTVNSMVVDAELDRYGNMSVVESYSITKNQEATFFNRPLSDNMSDFSLSGGGASSYESAFGYNIDMYSVPVGGTAEFKLYYTAKYTVRAGRPGVAEIDLVLTSDWSDYWYDSITYNLTAPEGAVSSWASFGNAYTNEAGTYELTNTSTGLSFRTLKRITPSDLVVSAEFPNSMFLYRITGWDIFYPAVGLVLLIIAIVLVSNRREKPLVPSVQYYPPERINPAEAAYIYNGNVNGRDITSIIYYWASHRHLSIEMRSKKRYTLHRGKPLDDLHDQYEAKLYSAMFALGDDESVTDSQLKNKFYTHVNTAAKGVKDQFTGEHELNKRGKPTGITSAQSIVMAVVWCSIFFTTMPILAGITEFLLSTGAVLLLFVLPLMWFLVKWISTLCFARRYKAKKPLTVVAVIVYLVASAITAVYSWFAFSGISLSEVTCILIPLLVFASALLWPYSYCKTDYGIDMLGYIIGFRQFLQLAEKERLEMLLEQNPSYYYDVLPFAQALGVSDIWEKKFDGMLSEPPEWFYGEGVNARSLGFGMNVLYTSMQSNVTSSPSSDGGGGGGGGGGFSGGGFSGGGFSGGGSGGGGGGRW